MKRSGEIIWNIFLQQIQQNGTANAVIQSLAANQFSTAKHKVRALTGLPVLAGGLITEKQEVLQALDAGALAISSTAPAVWQM